MDRKRSRSPTPPPGSPVTRLTTRPPSDGGTTIPDDGRSLSDAIRRRYSYFPKYRKCLLLLLRVDKIIGLLERQQQVLQRRADLIKLSFWPSDRTIPDDPAVADPIHEYIRTLPDSNPKKIAYYAALRDVAAMEERINQGEVLKRQFKYKCHQLRVNDDLSIPEMPLF